jgi:hypothetical protein
MHAPNLQAREGSTTLRANVHLCAWLHQTLKGVRCFAMSVQALLNADVKYVCASLIYKVITVKCVGAEAAIDRIESAE